MTAVEFTMCTTAVVTSSFSQLFMKASSSASVSSRALRLLLVGVGLQGISVVLTVLALRSMPLSQLVPFAASAYVLVPLGSYLAFEDKLTPRFWIGASFIGVGIAWSTY